MRCFCAIAVLMAAVCTWGLSLGGDRACVDIVLSSDLRPYMQVLEGFRGKYPGKVRTFVLTESQEDEEHVFKLLGESRCPVALSIGHRATKLASRLGKKKVYSLVLYPFLYKKLLSVFSCGVYLDIPPPTIASLCSKLIRSPRVGLMYSSSAIESYISEIAKALESVGGSLKSVRITSKIEFSRALSGLLKQVDILLFLPDPIFSSEEIIEWIILKAATRHKMVVGFNRFFLKAGATAVVAVDYQETGERTAAVVKDLVKTGKCQSVPAVYRMIVNKKALERLK